MIKRNTISSLYSDAIELSGLALCWATQKTLINHNLGIPHFIFFSYTNPKSKRLEIHSQIASLKFGITNKDGLHPAGYLAEHKQ